MRIWCRTLALAASAWLPGAAAWAGGSGLNVVVVVNQQSSNSVALGNYYCQLRHVPPQNLVRITNWTGGAVSWSPQQFTNSLLTPLRQAIQGRGLTNQADFVLLSMDFPYRVEDTTGANSTTAALYYGFKTNAPAPAQGLPDSCSLPNASSNSYAGSELAFRSVPSFAGSGWLTTMITASNLPLAMMTVEQGVFGDATFPTVPAYFVKAPSDPWRNIRYVLADTAVFDSRVQGLRPLVRTNFDYGLPPVPGISGAQTGFQNYNPFVTTFTPGSLMDNLTSIGGAIFENNDHLRIIDMLRAGAAGAYGTVIEPCAYLEKFPTPEVFFYQSRGFSLAECYYLGLTNPYQGLILGDPLSAPFAARPQGYWTSVPPGPLTGTASFALQANASDPSRPIGRVDCYVDGLFYQTVTNFSPRMGNSVSVTIDGSTTSYTVPGNASIASVASGLAAAINSKAGSMQVLATPRGDRIELSRTNGAAPATQLTLQSSGSTLFPSAALPQFLDTIAYGVRSYVLQSSASVSNKYLTFSITRTNGILTTVSVTNTSGATLGGFAQSLANALNTNASLSGVDGVIVEDVVDYGSEVDFNLRVRSAGWAASLAQAQLSSDISQISPTGQKAINENVTDLEPRNHLYIACGVTNLPLAFPLDTTRLSDGFHELTAVFIDGTSVAAQQRISTNIFVQNSTLTGSLLLLNGATNIALESTLGFQVSGSPALATRVDLYSTGGLLGSSNATSATFSIPATQLGPGLHPVYGIVTGSGGQQFRTATQWILIVDQEPPFRITATGNPLTLQWPATSGRSYTILSTDNLATGFSSIASITATNGLATWPLPNPPTGNRFYRVRTGS